MLVSDMTQTNLLLIGFVVFALTLISLTGLNDSIFSDAVKFLNPQDRADSIAVRINTGSEQKEYYSFSKIGYVKSNDHSFLLESIPSKDKLSYYKLVNNSLNSPIFGNFDVAIDIIAGDGSVIETLQYKKCKVEEYFTYVNDSKGKYRLTGDDTSKGLEIRDVTKLTCIGFSINIKT